MGDASHPRAAFVAKGSSIARVAAMTRSVALAPVPAGEDLDTSTPPSAVTARVGADVIGGLEHAPSPHSTVTTERENPGALTHRRDDAAAALQLTILLTIAATFAGQTSTRSPKQDAAMTRERADDRSHVCGPDVNTIAHAGCRDDARARARAARERGFPASPSEDGPVQTHIQPGAYPSPTEEGTCRLALRTKSLLDSLDGGHMLESEGAYVIALFALHPAPQRLA
ncbi:hypothetical protein T492DRAFT_846022 [Pavlovales sp. CCMP2436]|nr:hypothetical protein T492DRAFT_846022 [Pavlovales sp. CCMP2436]